MMGSKIQKNAIITSYINAYCLVCECLFDTVQEIKDHVQEDVHSKKLLAHPYLEKYGDNHIRKINKCYFCEFCGLLLPTAAKMSFHVQESSHYQNKGVFLLRRPSGTSSVTAFDDILIGEKAWHSLGDGTCTVCDEEFDDESIHKSEPAHLLKLIQTKVEFGDGNNVYRKTDDDSFQCITCNSVFRLNTLNEHFNNTEHKNLYKKCQEEMKKYKDKKSKNSTTKTSTGKTQDKDEKKEKDEKPVDKNYNNNAEKNIPTKVQTKVEPANTDHCKAIALPNVKIEDEPTKCANEKVLSNIKIEDEATKYANENNLTYNAGNTNAFCRICETKLPATLRSMKEHVNGKEHKNKLGRAKHAAKVQATPHITKRSMRKFIDGLVNVENTFHQDVVINDNYCIPLTSFMMVTKIGSKYRCQVCEVSMFFDDIGEHSDTACHVRALRDTPVITSLPGGEFVREVREGIFHCGYCNLIVPRWEDVDSHLQSREHKENKDASSWRLQRHLPGITQHRRMQEMEVFRMLMMGQNMFRH